MPTDYILDDTNDLLFKDGDLVFGESTLQHQHNLLLSNYGDNRQYPLLSVGVVNFINDDNFGDIKPKIRKIFELDGMEIERLNVYEDGKMDIKADY